jgi:hypothetical protein
MDVRGALEVSTNRFGDCGAPSWFFRGNADPSGPVSRRVSGVGWILSF